MTKALRRKVQWTEFGLLDLKFLSLGRKNCALLSYYAASSSNSLKTFRDKLSVPILKAKNPRSLKLGPTGCPETSVRNYRHSLVHKCAVRRIRHILSYTEWSKSLCVPDDYNTIFKCTETFWSLCINGDTCSLASQQLLYRAHNETADSDNTESYAELLYLLPKKDNHSSSHRQTTRV